MRRGTLAFVAVLSLFTAAFAAEESGKRNHPADDHSECMDRGVDGARGGCITRDDGTSRNLPPQALPAEPDTGRQSPPDAGALPLSELPVAGSGDR